jgi:hypothetical protein
MAKMAAIVNFPAARISSLAHFWQHFSVRAGSECEKMFYIVARARLTCVFWSPRDAIVTYCQYVGPVTNQHVNRSIKHVSWVLRRWWSLPERTYQHCPGAVPPSKARTTAVQAPTFNWLLPMIAEWFSRQPPCVLHSSLNAHDYFVRVALSYVSPRA